MLEPKNSTKPAWHPPDATNLPAFQDNVWGPLHSSEVETRKAQNRLRMRYAIGGLAIELPLLTAIIARVHPNPLMWIGSFLLFAWGVGYQHPPVPKNQFESESPTSDNPSSLNEAYVRMWVSIDGVIRGSDLGVIWVEGAALYFSGQRSWFRIARQDLANWEKPKGEFTFEDTSFFTPNRVLTVNSMGRKLKIALKDADQPKPSGFSNRLGMLIGAFIRTSEDTDVVTQLPPTSVDPHFRIDRWEYFLASLTGLGTLSYLSLQTGIVFGFVVSAFYCWLPMLVMTWGQTARWWLLRKDKRLDA